MTKIGLFGIGLDTYWPQFEGLLDKLTQYQQQIKKQIEKTGFDVVDAGMVDSVTQARAAARLLRTGQVEIVFLYVSTYALSSTVMPVVRDLDVPFVVLNLQPVPQLDYASFNQLTDRGEMTGIWLEHCQACAVPELASVFNRTQVPFHVITGYLDDPDAWKEIQQWCQAAQVAASLKNGQLGILGHYYNGMLDVYADLTRLTATFGTHMELLEMCSLQKIREEISPAEIQNKKDQFADAFDISPECSADELDRAAQTAAALEKLVSMHKLGSLAYYYEGEAGNAYENIVTSMIPGNTLLTARGIPVAGECEVKNALAMKILSEFGSGGSFSEFYLMDFTDDVIYLGHDGPAHHAIAEEKVKLVPLPVYHGKPGKGLSIQMKVKNGPVTLLSVVEGKDDVFLLCAQGEAVEGPTLQIGNTNSRYRFALGVKEFTNQWSSYGPAHHCAIGVGHIADKIDKLGKILGIKTVQIV